MKATKLGWENCLFHIMAENNQMTQWDRATETCLNVQVHGSPSVGVHSFCKCILA